MTRMGLDELAPELIELIVENAFEVNKKNVERGYDFPAIIEFHFLSNRNDLLERFQVWRDLLSLAATCKYLRRVVTPLVYYRDIQDNYTSSLLISAKRNNIAGISMALSHGADPHIGDRTTAVSWTFKHLGWKHWYVLNLEEQATPLHWAALNGHIEAMKLLLEHKDADINHRVRIDTSVARYRSIGCRGRADKFLEVFPFPDKPVQEVTAYIRHGLWGVDDSICYDTIEKGANPLYFALLAGNVEMSAFLIKAGSSLQTHLGTGTTALHQACQRGSIELVRLVLDHVSPSIEDAMGNTPVHYLPDDAPDRDIIIDFLLAKGGDAFAIGLKHKKVERVQLRHFFQRNLLGDGLEAGKWEYDCETANSMWWSRPRRTG
ncbi:uncharacterized protein NECHADRAFT_85933 [Fusarium vanettenii 77-13-4]|uniref:Ankyrin repeat protein n=1 Tax=Fusarium vanettenii (strain ATCC MYA-4622 / CBS 123669 / FGSC 9596 / NRRL 45880 / 77-13-4) TaxID=660122 RepID=C7Z1V9_FUSV7|nr:uncharacterized protein NECHADRAFT_85933 [Fusarium vanettenii 77-13-4]EEU42067.1 hypothetical protein NECHADRAFT_85933 [Fusarium vanettenii 77-13-4]